MRGLTLSEDQSLAEDQKEEREEEDRGRKGKKENWKKKKSLML